MEIAGDAEKRREANAAACREAEGARLVAPSSRRRPTYTGGGMDLRGKGLRSDLLVSRERRKIYGLNPALKAGGNLSG